MAVDSVLSHLFIFLLVEHGFKVIVVRSFVEHFEQRHLLVIVVSCEYSVTVVVFYIYLHPTCDFYKTETERPVVSLTNT